jgi:hypothetical protein
MAPDSFESDQLTTADDIAGQPETLMQDPTPAPPRGPRPSLFQMVCLGDKPQAKPAT